MLGGELELDAPFSAVSQDRVVKGGLGLKGGDIPTLGKGTKRRQESISAPKPAQILSSKWPLGK